jgi:glutamyl-tRNA reductase
MIDGDEQFHGEEAYRFLLEIICGIHSPIIGETEVLGQFKRFAQDWVRLSPKRATLVQRLFADAKQIRESYLKNLGHQSYGSWVRKNLRCDRVHILGAGHLAQEVVPYVLKRAIEVTVHARNESKVGWHSGPVRSLSEKAFAGGGALVIAAPMSAAEVREWMGGRPVEQIFDLRETSVSDPLELPGVRCHGLHDIFTQIEETRRQLEPLVEQVRREIRQRGVVAGQAAQVRPQGWDDLCA